MAIPQGFRVNFETLQRAFRNGDAALLECTSRTIGQPVYAIVAVHRAGDEFELVPFAQLFDGDPYEELDPPQP
jgi:hypothetical protein